MSDDYKTRHTPKPKETVDRIVTAKPPSLFKDKMVRVGILGTGVLFLGGLYVSYKYYQVKSFEGQFSKIIADRQAFFNLHNDLAFNFDSKIDSGERKHKISKYRKSILKFAEGKVLETGVGTSRNLQHYPLHCEVTAVDYSPKMIEVAL
jgi:hypothetical protein